MTNTSSTTASGVDATDTAQNGTGNVSPTSGSGAANVSSLVINATVTAHPSTGDDGSPGVPGGVIALLLCLLLVGVAVLCILFYLKRTGKLYKMIPFKPLTSPRRSSLTSSHRPLDAESHDAVDADHNQTDDVPQTRESAIFAIEDADMDSVDIDGTPRGTNDEYFYDEVFGKSVFEDEATNASMRQLYLASEEEEEEMFDVDAIVDSITGNKAQAKKT